MYSQIGLSMSDSDHLLRELNHRIQNNFQIIVSRMHLTMQRLPVDRPGGSFNLRAELPPAAEHPGHRLRFSLDPRRAVIFG